MKLIALTPIEHDGVQYAIGDELNVGDKTQAKALVSLGAAVTPDEAKRAAQAAAGEPDAT